MSNETTYNDRAITMTRAARQAACADAAKHWDRARNAGENIDQCRIVRLNELRATGHCINVACGREQLLFTVDGTIFCRDQLLPFLPPDMTVQAIQGCVHIANKIKEPVQTVAEVALLERQLQEEFELIGLLPASRRKELQTAHARNWFSDIVSRFSGIRSTFKELEAEEPMDSWPESKLDEFLEEAQPVDEMIERARKIRLGKHDA